MGGVPFVVHDGATGWLVPPGDPTATADAIQAALDDPAEAACRAARGRAEVLARFAAARLVADVRSLYRELVG